MRAAATVAAAVGVAGLVAVTGSARATHGGVPAPAAFRLADGSVACAVLDAGALACRGASVAQAVVLEADGETRAARLDVPAADAPVLAAGEGWWHGDTTCRADGAAIRCSNGRGSISVTGGGLAATGAGASARFGG